MCLTIDTKLHPKRKARVAGYDMLVWKWLSADLISPCYDMQWVPGVEACRYMCEEAPFLPGEIGPGLHADLSGTDSWYGCEAYPAIVPKGAEFYFGLEVAGVRNIVANRMTVYRTLEDALQGRTLGPANVELHKLVTA